MKYNNTITYDSKPIIIAICGKSATGKDTLAHWLERYLNSSNVPSRVLISDTTRLPRPQEHDGVDYNFITSNQFIVNIISDHYLEYSKFNDWYYGTPKNQINNEKINIGVFNKDGIKALSERLHEFTVVPIYIECDLETRMRRSYDRDRSSKHEIIRRMFADEKDFFSFKKKILSLFDYKLILESDFVTCMSRDIHRYLKREKVI